MMTLPLGLTPRELTSEQAAEHCGRDSLPAFDDWVRRGIVPRAMAGTTRWDRRASIARSIGVLALSKPPRRRSKSGQRPCG